MRRSSRSLLVASGPRAHPTAAFLRSHHGRCGSVLGFLRHRGDSGSTRCCRPLCNPGTHDCMHIKLASLRRCAAAEPLSASRQASRTCVCPTSTTCRARQEESWPFFYTAAGRQPNDYSSIDACLSIPDAKICVVSIGFGPQTPGVWRTSIRACLHPFFGLDAGSSEYGRQLPHRLSPPPFCCQRMCSTQRECACRHSAVMISW